MSIQAMKQALEALWNCTVKLESQQFRNPVQIPPVYSEIIKAGYLAHATLRAAIEAAERQEPDECQYAKDVSMPEYRCVGKCQYATPQPAIPAGWQLVPVEPTQEMLDAGEMIDGDGATYVDLFKAMLAAAPKPDDMK